MALTSFSGPVASQGGFTAGSFTTAQRDALTNVATGTLIFNTTAGVAQVYNGSAWVAAFGGGGPTVYTQGVDYSAGGVIGQNQFGANYIQITSANWGNPAGATALLTAPLGSIYTYVVGGTSYTAQSVAGGGANTINMTWIDTPPFLYGTNIESISVA